MKKIIFTLMGLIIGVFSQSTHAFAACGKVSISEMDWDSSIVVTAVSKFILEQGYGCDVTTVPSSVNPIITSLAETNSPDIATEIWINSAPALIEMEKAGKVKKAARVLSDGGEEGWWVPNYMVEQNPELATLKGVMANPELFGNLFHSCPTGWNCDLVNTSNFAALDMSAKGFEFFQHGSGETLASSLASAYEAKKPWFGYYWAPTPLLGKYPMTHLDIGAHDPDDYICAKEANCTLDKSVGFPNASVYTIITTTFANREPEAFALMNKVSFTNQVMGELLAWKLDQKATNEEVAVHFITNYQDIWLDWINERARNNLNALITIQ